MIAGVKKKHKREKKEDKRKRKKKGSWVHQGGKCVRKRSGRCVEEARLLGQERVVKKKKEVVYNYGDAEKKGGER
jgi:hypothetical protein